MKAEIFISQVLGVRLEGNFLIFKFIWINIFLDLLDLYNPWCYKTDYIFNPLKYVTCLRSPKYLVHFERFVVPDKDSLLQTKKFAEVNELVALCYPRTMIHGVLWENPINVRLKDLEVCECNPRLLTRMLRMPKSFRDGSWTVIYLSQ